MNATLNPPPKNGPSQLSDAQVLKVLTRAQNLYERACAGDGPHIPWPEQNELTRTAYIRIATRQLATKEVA